MIATTIILFSVLMLLLINAFAIVGFHLASQPGMILSFMQKIKGKIAMPLYDCPTCMASIHSSYCFIPFALIVNPLLLLAYPVYILSLAGLSTLIYNMVLGDDDGLITETETEKKYPYFTNPTITDTFTCINSDEPLKN